MTGERVDVLRLGYRLGRDPRITTHLALVGRALGADRFLLAGDELAEEVDRQLVMAAEVGPDLDAQEVEALLLDANLAAKDAAGTC